MADTRSCDQCGTAFTPLREHARFCSARCRAAWNREQFRDPHAEVNALNWSVAAMNDTAERLALTKARDSEHAFELTGETVWRITIVDATLIRHHLDAYEKTLAVLPAQERELTHGTLAGLRFVRNRMHHEADHDDFIHRDATVGQPGKDPITAWTWKSAPPPTLTALQPRARDWEMTRYHAYQDHLSGNAIGATFRLAVAFLTRAAAGLAHDATIPR